MECRLCLCSAPFGSSVSIHEYPHPLLQCILTSCQLQVNKDDLLPDTICLLCKNNLELLSNFRNICIQSEETQKLRLAESLDIKKEEIVLDDLIWQDDIDINSISNACQPAVDDEFNKSKSRNSGQVSLGDHLQQNENENSQILGGKSTHDNPYKCETCSKSFSYRSYYVRHVKSHIKDSHKRKICLKSFTFKYTLEEHMISHNGIKLPQCEICFKSFKHKTSLMKHMNTHTGEKRFICDICSKSFNLKYTLLRHMKSHAGVKSHKCEMCSKSFTTKPTLVEHINCHNGIKPYRCEVCLNTFTHKSTLWKHMKTHTGQKSYKCEICSESFKCKSHHMDHMNNYHI
ncbi:uncharacterized protein LOC143909656 [Arctopsyche grandis]|uniref:uncharacterized protein LOC143909656 n=1 Tax=Arctopsyche grandis TaxID=121162 RepID=UPI00406D8E71